MDNFKYDKHLKNDFNHIIKIGHKPVYKIYQTIEPDLFNLSTRMYNIEKEFVIPKKGQFDLSLQETVYFARKIINNYFGAKSVFWFDEMIRQDKIIFYNKNSEMLTEEYGDDSIYLRYNNEIHIPLSNNIVDVYALVHEFTHALQPYDINYLASYELLNEISPIFMEILSLDYLSSITNNDLGCYLMESEERIIDNYKFNSYVNGSLYNKNLISTYNNYSYDIGRIFACLIYKNYLEDKEKTMDRFIQFLTTVGDIHFNKSMKILGFDIKYSNNKLQYNDVFLEKIMDCYQEYVKMVEVSDISLMKKKIKR